MPAFRRDALRAGAALAATGLAGCLSPFGDNSGCGGDSHASDVELAQSGSWPTIQYDAGNTGYNPDASGPTSPDSTVAWRTNACTEAEAGVAVHGGSAYAGGLVVDGETGNVEGGEWGAFASTPTVARDTVFVGMHDLEARDPETGSVEWTYSTTSGTGGLPAPKVASGRVVVPGGINDRNVYAVGAADGEERWQVSTIGNVDVPVAISSDGTVFVVTDLPRVHAIDLETGDERWQRDLDGLNFSISPVTAGGRLYLGFGRDAIRALDAETGEQVWTQTDCVGGRVAVEDDRLYVVGSEGVEARDANDGTRRWTESLPDAERIPPAVTDDLLCVADRPHSGHRTVRGLDPETGEEYWAVQTRDVFFGDYTRSGVTGLAVVDDAVYATTAPGDLYAIAPA